MQKAEAHRASAFCYPRAVGDDGPRAALKLHCAMSGLFSSHSRTPRQSLQEYGRGLAGGLIFSLPLLFTMEVWWAGFSVSALRLLGYVATTFALLLLYNRFAGLRRDASMWEVAIDSVEELGLGLLTAAGVLWLFGEVQAEHAWIENLGKIVMEGMTVAIGFAIGTAQLGDESAEQGEGGMTSGQQDDDFLSQMALAACGAVVFVSNVAPTDEILVLSAQATVPRLLGIVLFSLLLCGLVLHFSEFRGARRPESNRLSQMEPRTQGPSFTKSLTPFLVVRGLVTTYAVALVCAAGALFFFGRLDSETFAVNLGQIVVAGLPAALGASAGRLLVQSGAGQRDDAKNDE